MRKPGDRKRVLDRLAGEIKLETRDRAEQHAAGLKVFRQAQATTRSFQDYVQGQESALQERLGAGKGVDPGTLRLYHVAIEQGRRDHADATQREQRAERELDSRREALFGTLKKRTRMQEVIRQHAAGEQREQDRLHSASLDELWLLRRNSKS